jgi:kynurenine formamidase
MRIIDLSAPIVGTRPDAASFERVEIEYRSHADGAGQIQAMLGVSPELLRHGEGWAIEEFTRLGTHSVTHVDAPWHYNSTIQGQPAATIDELPLDWFFSDGVVLDMSAKADGESVGVRDVESALATIPYTPKPLDIVLLRTGRDARGGRRDSLRRAPARPWPRRGPARQDFSESGRAARRGADSPAVSSGPSRPTRKSTGMAPLGVDCEPIRRALEPAGDARFGFSRENLGKNGEKVSAAAIWTYGGFSGQPSAGMNRFLQT